MRDIVPIQDGAFPFSLELLPDALAEPDAAASMLDVEHLPESITIPIWCYLVPTEEGLGLVDAGGGTMMGEGFGRLSIELPNLDVDPAAITRVWLTHLHGDHCGGLLRSDGTRAFPNAKIAVSADEVAFWQHRDLPERLRPVAEDAERVMMAYANAIDLVEPGQRVDAAQGLAAPGHTPGHLAWLFDDHQALAAGDLLHVAALQFPRLDWSTKWDRNPVQAAGTRKALIAKAKADGLALLTGHAGAYSSTSL